MKIEEINNKSMLEYIENSLKKYLKKYLFRESNEIMKQEIYYDVSNILREYDIEIINSVFDEGCCYFFIGELGTLNINFYKNNVEI